MIQRIQSVFLFLAALCVLGPVILPLATSPATELYSLFADAKLDGQDSPVFLVLWGLAAVLALVAIFLFRNRKIQVQFTWFYILVVLAALGFGLYLLLSQGYPEGTLPGWGLLSLLAGLIFSLLARNRIRKDDKLVRSMDRLR